MSTLPSQTGERSAELSPPSAGLRLRRVLHLPGSEGLWHRLALAGAVALIAAIVFGTLPLHPF